MDLQHAFPTLKLIELKLARKLCAIILYGLTNVGYEVRVQSASLLITYPKTKSMRLQGTYPDSAATRESLINMPFFLSLHELNGNPDMNERELPPQKLKAMYKSLLRVSEHALSTA